MNRNEFLNELEKALGNMSQQDKNDILYDYQEHFNAGLSKGHTEEDICSRLGDPWVIAKQYKVEHAVRQADENRSVGNILRAVFAALSLGFFNLIFILPIMAGLLGILAGLYGIALGVLAGGVCLFLAVLLGPLASFVNLPAMNPGILVFASIGLTAMGLLFTIADSYITKFFYMVTLKYVKANIRIISR